MTKISLCKFLLGAEVSSSALFLSSGGRVLFNNENSNNFFLAKRPWSFSKLQKIGRCPRQYDLDEQCKKANREEGIRPPLEVNPMAGTVIHAFLQEVFAGRQKIGDFLQYVNVQEVPYSVKLQLLVEVNKVPKMFKNLMSTIGNTLRESGEKGRVRLSSEFTIALNTELEKSPKDERPALLSIIDLLAMNDQTAVIVDFKSNLRGLEDYKKQVHFYAMMAKFRFPSLTRVETYLAGINENQIMHIGSHQTANMTKESLRDFLISMFDFTCASPSMQYNPKKNKYCKYCTHRGMCPLFMK